MKVYGTYQMVSITLVALLVCSATFGQSENTTMAKPVADFYVSANGKDAHSGTASKPFATLQRVRDAVRKALASGKPRDIRVLIRGGLYRVNQTVVFALKDSAAKGHRITYEAYPKEKPIFTAGVPIAGWRKLKKPPEGLARRARGHVWYADLPEGLNAFKTLYDGSTRLPRARGKGFLPTDKPHGWHSEDQHRIRFPKGAMRKWRNLKDVEIVMITAAPWTMNALPLSSVNEETLVARTAVSGTYALTRPRFGKFAKSAWIENALSVLDEPGEWVLDSKARRIYLWPTGDEPSDAIVAPALTELIRVEGKIDYDGPKDKPVQGLVFRGLTFTQGDRFTWEKSRRGWGLQHDWEMFDRPTAMVRLRGAERCAFEKCNFVNAGSTGIRLDLHCRENAVDGNVFERLGGVGVLLAGYGPGVKDVNKNNRVTRNHIHKIGELYWHSPAIFVWQSGENLIGNNLIHNTPYTGIVVSGRIVWDRRGNGECSRTVRWAEVDKALGKRTRGRIDWKVREPFLHARNNIVLRNEIHNVMEVMTDGNGIYISGSGGGNVVRENLVRDCPSKHFAEGIRCDDDQYDTIVDRNIIWNLGGMATFVTIKGRNDVTNNIFANPLNPPKRGMLSLELLKGQVLDGANIQRNIFYTTNKADKICYQGQNYYGTTIWLRDANTDHNLYFSTANPKWGKAHLANEQKHGSEKNSVVADPLFMAPEKGDFRLRKDSPALKLGFEPIDIEVIGLTGRE